MNNIFLVLETFITYWFLYSVGKLLLLS